MVFATLIGSQRDSCFAFCLSPFLHNYLPEVFNEPKTTCLLLENIAKIYFAVGEGGFLACTSDFCAVSGGGSFLLILGNLNI